LRVFLKSVSPSTARVVAIEKGKSEVCVPFTLLSQLFEDKRIKEFKINKSAVNSIYDAISKFRTNSQ
jgi:hypothetical protein